MTELLTTGQLVAEFLAALNAPARAAIVTRRNGVEAVDSARTILICNAAREHGWTAQELASECSRAQHGADNLTALITYRLRACAEGVTERPKPTGPARFIQPKPWCGEELCQEAGRWRLDPKTRTPVGHCDCWTDPNGSS